MAYMRIADRTFFIYDHSITKREEDDPKDAILYFFPQNTSVDAQCIFCSQLMGMVKCTKTLAGAPPKLYKLRRTKVATHHEGNFTLGLACKMRIPDSAILQKLDNLYRVFAFYHGSISHVKQIASNNEAFLSNMASIWDFYVPYVRRYGNTVPAMFEPIPRVKLYKGGNFLFLRCSHLLQWLKGQTSLLAGCILYKRSVLCSQLTPELTSHMLLIKPNQLHHPSKSVTDTILPFGVRIMSVYVTKQQYEQLSQTPEPSLKHCSLSQTKLQDAPPSSQTDLPNSAPQAASGSSSKRKLEKRHSSVTGRLFSNFTGMLEGTVVESLWPSLSASGTASSKLEFSARDNKRDSPMDESLGMFRDGKGNVVMLSRSSDDVVKALQGDMESPGGGWQTFPTCSPNDMAYESDHSPKPQRYHDFQSSGVCQSDGTSIASSGTQAEDTSGFAETGLPNSSLRPDDKLDLMVAVAFETGAPLEQSDKAMQSLSVLSQHKHKSPESGIGDCAEQGEHQDFSDSNCGEKNKEAEEVVQNAPVEKFNPVQVVSVGSFARTQAGIKDELSHESSLCKDGISDKVFVIGEDATSQMKSACDANTNAVQIHASDIPCTLEDLPQQKSKDSGNVNATHSNPGPNLANEERDHSVEKEYVMNLENEELETHSRDINVVIKPDILQGSQEEHRENPDLLNSSEMKKHATYDHRNEDIVEDINSNITPDKTEDQLTNLEDICSGITPDELKDQFTNLSTTSESVQGVTDAENRPHKWTGAADSVRVNLPDAERQTVVNTEIARKDGFTGISSMNEPNTGNNRGSCEEKLANVEEIKTTEMCEDDKDVGEPVREKTSTSKPEPHIEAVSGLVNLCLYVQAHSDTTLLFLAEKAIMEEQDTLLQLWQSVLRELGELELQLKTVVKPDREIDVQVSHNVLHFDKLDRSLEGSITNPVNQEESIFCRGCQVLHEQFLSDPTLTDITLRNHQTVIYAHQNACHHTFFHKNYKSNPSPGIPARDDPGFYIQNSCKEAMKEYNKNWL